VPPLHADTIDDTDNALTVEISNTKIKVEQLIETFKFREALFEVIDLARKGNKYLQQKEPWKKTSSREQLAESDSAQSSQLVAQSLQHEIDNCLHLCLQLTANLAILINPFLPFTAKKMLHMMKVVDKMLEWENAGKIKLLSVGYSLRAPELLFRKIEDAEVTAQIEKLKRGLVKSVNEVTSNQFPVPSPGLPTTGNQQLETSGQPAIANLKSEIIYDDFAKLDLRVGTIVSAEKIGKADKLLKLQIDLGFETRTIVSGIAQYFKPEEIISKQVVVVVNLAPRKMRGIESNGMILMAEDANGKLHFINPENSIDAGSAVT
jgi:methionyl-tRNA synthetase